MKNKPGRAHFTAAAAKKPATAKKPPAAKKPAAARKKPAKRPTTQKAALREAKKGAFAVHLADELTRHSNRTATKKAAKKAGVQQKDAARHVARMDAASQERGNSMGLKPHTVDPRDLEGNSAGAGRPSAWDKKSRAALVKYLLSRPKAKSGVAQWPSTEALAADEAMQGKIKVPSQSSRAYATIAAEEGLKWVGRYALLKGQDY